MFKDVVPKTAENFKSLCTGKLRFFFFFVFKKKIQNQNFWNTFKFKPFHFIFQKGFEKGGKVLTYKGSPFHRVIPGFVRFFEKAKN